MSVEITTPVVEKVARIALPVVEVENFKVLEYKNSSVDGAPVAFVTVNDIEEYAQVALVTKTCTNVIYSSGNKTCTIVIDGTIERNQNQVALLNPEFKGKVVVIQVNYNGAERLRLSAKTVGTAKAPKTLKSAFFELDLANVIELDGANYINGKEGSVFSKETNTKIARVVKALLPYGILYSDEDKTGFHKGLSKIPTDVRENDNYTFFFNFAEITEKLSAEKVVERIAANLIAKATPKGATISDDEAAKLKAEAATIAATLNVDANEVIANIISVINFYYPSVVVDTTKELYLECLKSAFAELKSEKLVFDATTKTVVSKKEEADRLKAENKAKREAEREANKAATKAAKKAKASEESAEEAVVTDAVEGINPIAKTEEAAPTLVDLSALGTPAVAAPTINPAALLNSINPMA